MISESDSGAGAQQGHGVPVPSKSSRFISQRSCPQDGASQRGLRKDGAGEEGPPRAQGAICPLFSPSWERG